jgi:hypothetical protein
MTHVEALRREIKEATVFALLAATDADRLTLAAQIAQAVHLPSSEATRWSGVTAVR